MEFSVDISDPMTANTPFRLVVQGRGPYTSVTLGNLMICID